MLEIHVLGQFSLRSDGEFILIPSRPAQSLFAYLVLNPGLTLRREKLAGMLWPDATEENARGYLRSALWRIRKSFEEAESSWEEYLAISEIELSFLEEASFHLDANAILERRDAGAWTAERLKDALEKYGGELLPGFYDEWVVLERERIHAAFDQKMRLYLNLLLGERKWGEALDWAEQWIVKGYAPEPAYRALMVAHAGMGDLSSAIAVYRRCQESLRRDLGVEPSEELRSLRDMLTRGEMPIEAMGTIETESVPIEDEPPEPGDSPYKGLAFFDTEDADLFFGRDTLTSRLVGHLRENQFLAVVVGASGSGKSSVVRAGLIPTLQRGKKLPDGTDPPKGCADWHVRVITPGAHPLETLALALTAETKSLQKTGELIDDLKADPRSLHLAARRLTEEIKAPRLLLVIDQFEEIFSLCKDESERQSFIENLMVAIDPENDGPTTVVITLRADFYAHCSDYRGLREAFSRQAYIGAMNTEELRQVVEQPARKRGWTFQPGLMDLFIRDVRGEPGALPLLSHALLETWTRRSGKMMTLKGYAEAGGVRSAIAKTAESVHQALDPVGKRIARSIFIRLTELSPEMQNTRRRASLEELVTDPAQAEQVRQVLNTLADARLVTLGRKTAEVAHEALIREWPTLQEWLEEDRESLLLHRHLTQAAQEWEVRGRDESELYRGSRLLSAIEWIREHPGESNPLEQAFLDASQSQEEHEIEERQLQQQRELEATKKLAIAERERAETQERLSSRLRWFARGLSLLLVMTVGAAGLALWQRNRAENEAHIAKARELASAATTQFDQDPQLSILLALDAVEEARLAGDEVPRQVEEVLHQSVVASRLERNLEGHDWRVYDVTFSPEDALIVSASFDGTARVWDAESGDLIAILDHETRRTVTSVDFNPDGSLLATGSNDRNVRLWDTSTWEIVKVFEGHTSFVQDLAFSPDGSQIASVDRHGHAYIRDHETGEILYSFFSQAIPFMASVAYSPDGRYLAAGANGLYIWEIASGELVFEAEEHGTESVLWREGSIEGLAYSPDGKFIAAIDFFNVAKVFDAKSGEAVLDLTGHTDTVLDLAFDPSGDRIATSGLDRRVILWDVETGDPLFTLGSLPGPVLSVDFNRSGTKLVTATMNGDVQVWDVALKREVQSMPVPGTPTALSFSPDGAKIVVASEDSGSAYLYDVQSGRLETRFVHGSQDLRILGLDFDPAGALLATASSDTLTRLWDPTNGEIIQTIEGHEATVHDVAFSPDGEILASSASDTHIKLWRVEDGSLVRTLQATGIRLNSVAFHPEGTYLAAGNASGAFMLWTLSDYTGETIGQHNGMITDVVFHPAGTQVASASVDGSVKVWDVESGEILMELVGHDASVEGLDFNHDGSLIATASLDGSVRIWDGATGALVLVFPDPTGGGVLDVAFSPDQPYLAALGPEGIHIFTTDLEDLVGLASERVFRGFTAEECEEYFGAGDCKERVEEPTPRASLLEATEKHRICEVLEPGDAYSGGYGQTIYEGTLLVKEELGWDQYAYESDFVADYVEGIETLLNEGCDLLLAPGFNFLPVENSARDNPDQKFVLIDVNSEVDLKNLWKHYFTMDQGAFLAGYVAAHVTQTGKVGTFGGAPIAPVLDFMIGFEQGVFYFNENHGTDVEVIGWNSGTGTGEFLGSFCCLPEGYDMAQRLIDQGADIIFPVAGSYVGFGALMAVQEGQDLLFIGVDVDQVKVTPVFSPWILTSIEKRSNLSVLHIAEAYDAGTFTGGAHFGTLENGEVGLSPFYDNDHLISAAIKAELEEIRAGIISGEIQTNP